jgi:hypothetical protein
VRNRDALVSLLLVFVMAVCTASAKTDCPTTATCAEHGLTGNPTGKYKWHGAQEYAKFSYPVVTLFGAYPESSTPVTSDVDQGSTPMQSIELTTLNVEELQTRLRKMSDKELRGVYGFAKNEYGQATAAGFRAAAGGSSR